MFFNDSRPDRKKRADKAQASMFVRERELVNSPFPPPKVVEFMSEHDVLYAGDRTLVGDVETYPNYWLIGFKDVDRETYLFFEITPNGYAINGYPVEYAYWTKMLTFVLHRFLIITFNGHGYDMPMTLLAMMGVPTWRLKEVNDEIILEGMRPYQIERKYGVKSPKINHIDIMEVAPLHDGLKTYAGRLHAPRMQELPYKVDRILSKEEADNVRGYNVNDLDNTALLYLELKPQIELREQLGREYSLDLRSKSDAQIAEAIIGSELRKLGVTIRDPNIKPGTLFTYQKPEWVKFKTPEMQRALEVVMNSVFEISDAGKAKLPPGIAKLKIPFDGQVYKMGNGGLHSTEKSIGYVATKDMLIIDRDVASYYPWIIINNGLAPEHLGSLPGSNESPYIIVYRDKLVLRRLKLKAEGNKLEAGLKIAINGTFGKNGNKYSKTLYAPQLVIQTTITGQFGLLLQIEMVTLAGFKVVSANTDGIVILCPPDRVDELAAVYDEWERITGFKTEEARYAKIFSRDVNNYIAVKLKYDKKLNEWVSAGDPKGKYLHERLGTKTKGVYSELGSALNSVLSKNPETLIVSDAVQTFLAHGTPVNETIMNCRDIRRFISIKKATGGAEKDDVYLGKVIRWYYAKDVQGSISRVANGNSVGKSEGAMPLMDLPEGGLPADLDIDWYINEAYEELYKLGYYHKPKTAQLFA